MICPMRSLSTPANAPPLPAGSPFARVSVVGPNDEHRTDVEAFIAEVYRDAFGATVESFLPALIAFHAADGSVRAVVGLRSASDERLFVEQYLDAPAEQAVAGALATPVERSHMVEIGSLAARDAGDARAIIVYLTRWLHCAGIRWVLFAATRQLRNAFARLRLAPVALAVADPARLSGDAKCWGSYYQSQPRVVCGDVASGYRFLQRTLNTPDAEAGNDYLPFDLAWAGN